MIRLGYFADGPWSHAALDRILALEGVEVAFVTARYANPDPLLRRQAERLGVPFFVEQNVNRQEAIERFVEQQADLFVSMSFDQILRAEIRNAARLGFINCHAGALPYYRGRNVLNWALINGEERFGVTVHYVDDGIDTGDVILQRFAPIALDDTYAEVLEAAYPLCAKALSEAIRMIANGVAPRIPQTEIAPLGFYCSQRRPGDEWIDWSWTSRRLHNFVRGIAPPGPAARFTMNGEVFAATRTRLIEDAPCYIGIEGAVVGRRDGVAVKTGDSWIEITEVRPIENEGALGAAFVPDWGVGTRLGGALHKQVNVP